MWRIGDAWKVSVFPQAYSSISQTILWDMNGLAMEKKVKCATLHVLPPLGHSQCVLANEDS